MDRGTPKASDYDRRVSMRNSVRISVHGGEDEDYGFASGAIADGFRPSHLLQSPFEELPSPSPSPSSSPSPSQSPSASSSRTFAVPDEANSPTQTSTRPSSISKPPRGHESLTLRHDGGFGAIRGPAFSRDSSISSASQPYMRPESPYLGPSGPSHPYQIYPQDVRIARTLSVATTSTATAPVSNVAFTGPSRPTHPYGLYPQGTVDDQDSTSVPSIPVGFHSSPDQYQRRLGNEGEEVADMIGPDGHTEQLPPYTRYPDEAYARKVREVQQPIGLQPPTALSSSSAIEPSSSSLPGTFAPLVGAGGIGLAARNPEFDELDSPQSRHSSRSFTSSSDISHHDINTAAAAVSEKEKPRTKFQLWARRRLWGIVPFWAILLTGIVILVMGIILGAVIGTFLAKRKKIPTRAGDSDADTDPTVTVSYDAVPVSTPSDLPDLPTGSFSMPLINKGSSYTCFNDTQQSQAWNCNLIYAGLNMTVIKDTATPDAGDYLVSLTCNTSFTMDNHVYTYGMQPPVFSKPLAMDLVNDTIQSRNWGPAWFRMMPYSKMIIIPEPALIPTTTTVSTRQLARVLNRYGTASSGSDFKRKGIAGPGDKPWICTWPETYLELFIYPQANSSWNNRFGTTTSSSTTITTAPTDTPNTVASTPTVATPTGTQGTATTGAAAANTSTTGSFTDGFDMPPPAYPRVVKLEERRIDRSPTPFCRQVEIQANGIPAKPVKDASGNDVVVYIAEADPDPVTQNQVKDDGKLSHAVSQRDDLSFSNSLFVSRDTTVPEVSDCGCIWIVT